MNKFSTTLPWLYSRQTFLIAGTLLLSVSPFLCATFYFGAALISALNWKQLILNRERLAMAILIVVISGWMILRKVRPESLLPGTVSLSDYIPFFIFFFLITLRPFSESEVKKFCYALILTIPQQFLMAVGEKYLNWYGRVYFPWERCPIIDFYIGPFEKGLATSAGFFNPNILGCYCVLCAGVCLSLLMTEIESFRVAARGRFDLGLGIILASCCLALCVVLLIWTGSRNAWIAFLFLLSIFTWLQRKVWYVRIGGLALPLLTVIALVNLGGLTQAARFFIPEIIWSRLPSVYSVFSAADRGNVYNCAIKLIEEKPITGWGIGQFGPECSMRTGEAMNHAHNILLQLFTEIGLPFSILLVSFIIYIFFLNMRFLLRMKFYKINKVSIKYKLCTGLIIVAISGISMQFFDLAILMSYRLNFIFWFSLAIPYSIIDQIKSSENI